MHHHPKGKLRIVVLSLVIAAVALLLSCGGVGVYIAQSKHSIWLRTGTDMLSLTPKYKRGTGMATPRDDTAMFLDFGNPAWDCAATNDDSLEIGEIELRHWTCYP